MLTFIVLLALCWPTHASDYSVVCYYTNWAQYRDGLARFTPSNIDAKLCTHVIFAFAKINIQTKKLEKFEGNDEERYQEIIALKSVNPDLKVLLAVGGWNHENDNSPFSVMANTSETRNIFVTDAIAYLRERGFDGLDLDWEYPAVRGGSLPEDKHKFTLLCSDLRKAFESESQTSEKGRLLLTAAVASGRSTIEKAYEIKGIADAVDWINLMAYDLYGSWNPTTGHHTAMEGETDTVKKSLQQWLDGGMPPSKVALGLSTYGRGFNLKDSTIWVLGSPAVGPSEKGRYTKEAGFLSYFEICMKTWNNKKAYNESIALAPYASNGVEWVGYDDVDSIMYKSKELIVKLKLKGAMFWTLDFDDFTGEACSMGKYPLLNAAKAALEGKPFVPITPAPETTTPWTGTLMPVIPPREPKSEHHRICYFTNWSQYRKGAAAFTPSNIDPTLCTHIVYAFAQIDEYTHEVKPIETRDEEFYSQIVDLKTINPDLIVTLAVGGANHDNTIKRFASMSRTVNKRKKFIMQTISFLRKRGFDGLDLDWAYPSEEERELFSTLCKELRQAFELDSQRTGKERLLLTAAVSASTKTISTAYEVDKISPYVDYIYLMSYDLYGAWNSETGHNTAMKGADNTVIKSVQTWIDRGMPKEKIVLGIATYGRSFHLKSSFNHKIGAMTAGGGRKGQYTQTEGFLAYYEICKQHWDKIVGYNSSSVGAPYAVAGSLWIGYDDIDSVVYKTKEVIMKMGLKGAMFWTLDFDDFEGTFCNEGQYPLINAVRLTLQGKEVVKYTTPAPTTLHTTIVTGPAIPPKEPKATYHRACYFTSWSQYRPNDGKLLPSDIDPYLCTHIIYAFAKIEPYTLKLSIIEKNDEIYYKQIIDLKKKNPDLIVSLAVGGANHDKDDKNSPFTEMVRTSLTRKIFVVDAIEFLRKHGFDGLDLDWEYPKADNKYRFTLLCKDLREGFELESQVNGKHRLLLTAAVSASNVVIKTAYEVEKIATYLDYIYLMAYDLYGSWNGQTGHHTGMERAFYTVKSAIENWTKKKMPKDKIVLGLATYGRSFKLKLSTTNGIGAPTSGPGKAGKYTKSNGILAYYEICSEKWDKIIPFMDSEVRSPYNVRDALWVGYDDMSSMIYKTNELIVKMKLKGAMIWTLDFDDFSGKFCDQGKYPLINAIKRTLEVADSATTPQTTLETTTFKDSTKLKKGSVNPTVTITSTASNRTQERNIKKSEKNTKDKSMLIIVGTVVVVLLFGLVGLALYMTTKRKKRTNRHR